MKSYHADSIPRPPAWEKAGWGHRIGSVTLGPVLFVAIVVLVVVVYVALAIGHAVERLRSWR